MPPAVRTIRDRGIRKLLISNFRELQLASRNHMNTATLILAGGIVEGVLIDYLQAIGYTATGKRSEPNEMSLEDVIAVGAEKGALTPETQNLCKVLQGYRNLVHPGRVVREDQWPTASRAELSAVAVERVLADVQERVRTLPQWAADVLADSADVPFVAEAALARQAGQLPAAEAERLLLEIVPDRLELVDSPKDDEGYWAPVLGYRACLGAVLGKVSSEARRAAAVALMERLEFADPTDDPEKWIETFFFPELLDSLDESERGSLSAQLVWSLDPLFRRKVQLDVSGIGRDLSPVAIPAFVKACARAYLSKDDAMREFARKTLLAEAALMEAQSRKLVASSLEGLVSDCEAANQSASAASLAELRYEVEPLRDEDVRK